MSSSIELKSSSLHSSWLFSRASSLPASSEGLTPRFSSIETASEIFGVLRHGLCYGDAPEMKKLVEPLVALCSYDSSKFASIVARGSCWLSSRTTCSKRWYSCVSWNWSDRSNTLMWVSDGCLETVSAPSYCGKSCINYWFEIKITDWLSAARTMSCDGGERLPLEETRSWFSNVASFRISFSD